MHKQTIIAIVAAIVIASEYLLYSWGVGHSLTIMYQIVQLSCYAYLVYYLFWSGSHSPGRTAFLSKIWKLYSIPLRIVGWIFVVGGVFMTLFAFGRIFDDSLQSDKSGDWEGAGMSLLGILLGVLSIKISKKLNSTGEQPNRTAQANHSTRGANEN